MSILENDEFYGHYEIIDFDDVESYEWKRSFSCPDAVVVAAAAAAIEDGVETNEPGDYEKKLRDRELPMITEAEEFAEMFYDCVTIGVLVVCIVMAWPKRLCSCLFG